MKTYCRPEMKEFRLEQGSNLLQSSETTPVIHEPIGERLVDTPDPLV